MAAGRAIMDKGLTWGNADNISLRLDEHTVLITASFWPSDDRDAIFDAFCTCGSGNPCAPRLRYRASVSFFCTAPFPST